MPSPPRKQRRTRCMKCRVKLNLIDITLGTCLCANVFCSSHRHPEEHACEFDHKTRQRAILATRNPGVGVIEKVVGGGDGGKNT